MRGHGTPCSFSSCYIMKLLGIEFEQFACFDRQWIPLQPGVNILVGKNNKEKTAILRGLGSLTLLPIPSSQPSRTAAQGYFRKPANYFDLNLVFALEDSDTIIPFVVANDDAWRGILATEKPLLKFRWRMRPASNMAYFLKCSIIVGGREVELLAPDSHDNNNLTRRTYRYPGLEAAGRTLYAHSGSKSENWIFNFAADDALFAPQVSLKSVLYVDAHRTNAGRECFFVACGTTEVVPFPYLSYPQSSCFLWPIWKRAKRVTDASQKHEASRGAPGSFARQEQKRLAQDDNPIIRAANDPAALGMTGWGEVYGSTEAVPFHSKSPKLSLSAKLLPLVANLEARQTRG